MFGLTNFLTALKRLTKSIGTTADLFDAANQQLAARLRIDPEIDADTVIEHVARPALEDARNGTAKPRGGRVRT